MTVIVYSWDFAVDERFTVGTVTVEDGRAQWNDELDPLISEMRTDPDKGKVLQQELLDRVHNHPYLWAEAN